MKFLYKMERKFGKFAIPHLMRYILGIYCIGFILEIISERAIMSGLMTNTIYNTWLMLDIEKILHGQVWRLVTFIIQPPEYDIISMLFFLLLYYMVGDALENALGTFLFNLYFVSGVILNIIATVVFYLITKTSIPLGVDYLNQALFLAFAVLFPEMKLLLFFILPVKVKWLGIVYGCVLGYNVLSCISDGLFDKTLLPADRNVLIAEAVAIIISLLNFLLFFLLTRNFKRYSFKELKRRSDFARSVERARRETGQARGYTTISRHKCAICGRTEKDDETLEFRFCSKCNGNYEYCSDHLYTHVHVTNAYPDIKTVGNTGSYSANADKSAESGNEN